MADLSTCTRCGRTLPVDQFTKGAKGRPTRRCYDCAREYRSDWYARRHPELKRLAYDALGGKCEDCGQDNYDLLWLTYKAGGGTADRKRRGKLAAYRRAIAGSDEFRLLCPPCALDRQREGIRRAS